MEKTKEKMVKLDRLLNDIETQAKDGMRDEFLSIVKKFEYFCNGTVNSIERYNTVLNNMQDSKEISMRSLFANVLEDFDACTRSIELSAKRLDEEIQQMVLGDMTDEEKNEVVDAYREAIGPNDFLTSYDIICKILENLRQKGLQLNYLQVDLAMKSFHLLA